MCQMNLLHWIYVIFTFLYWFLWLRKGIQSYLYNRYSPYLLLLQILILFNYDIFNSFIFAIVELLEPY